MSNDIKIDRINDSDGIDECMIDGAPIKPSYRLKLGGMHIYLCDQCFFQLADECEYTYLEENEHADQDY